MTSVIAFQGVRFTLLIWIQVWVEMSSRSRQPLEEEQGKLRTTCLHFPFAFLVSPHLFPPPPCLPSPVSHLNLLFCFFFFTSLSRLLFLLPVSLSLASPFHSLSCYSFPLLFFFAFPLSFPFIALTFHFPLPLSFLPHYHAPLSWFPYHLPSLPPHLSLIHLLYKDLLPTIIFFLNIEVDS